MSLVVKIEQLDINDPYYREVKLVGPLVNTLQETVDPSWKGDESIQEYIYRREKIMTHLKKVADVYIDDKSSEFLKEMMSLSNEAISQVLERHKEAIFKSALDRSIADTISLQELRRILYSKEL